MAVWDCTTLVHDVAVQYGMVLAWANNHNGGKVMRVRGLRGGGE